MSEEFIKVILPERFGGKRIDSALAEMMPNISRSKITSTIKAGDALLNGYTFKPKDKVSGEEVIYFNIKQKQNNLWAAENIPLDIVYEDEDILIINKPFGLVTHPGAGNREGTLANALLHYNADLSKLDRAGIVHRLDKNTSGLMVVAKNPKTQKYLVEQFQTHSVEREYSAIVYGNMISGGTVDDPIGRDSKDRIKQAVRVNGKNAVTHYRVIDRYANHTHIKATLETGRTHQIRVHLSSIGHPLVGDPLYGGRLRFPKKASEEIKEALKAFQRQALHSKKLTLIHPTSGSEMSWKIELPDDMARLLDVLNNFD
ncbi:23S rRNA pseudouridine(1911/1915/1917) synthase RluD [Candidatus Thioglobus sp.]|nr:23S rRNA pseudouridine(1911/1915/1917) synthase RluD [Candidatus Thioglobus sp.]|tara:strand:- start:2178 stop:3122 length:945 start_codon:yes stop_codon:yes gene_type:complete